MRRCDQNGDPLPAEKLKVLETQKPPPASRTFHEYSALAHAPLRGDPTQGGSIQEFPPPVVVAQAVYADLFVRCEPDSLVREVRCQIFIRSHSLRPHPAAVSV